MSDFEQSGDDVRVRGMKGQAIHLHGQMSRFPTSNAETHKSWQDRLLLEIKMNTVRNLQVDISKIMFHLLHGRQISSPILQLFRGLVIHSQAFV